MAFDFGDLAGVGVSAATGNLLGAATSAIGLGMSIFGGMQQSSIAKQQAQVSMDEARQEQGINDVKQQAMELSGRRQQLEIIRTNQRARALAENSATNQGAQFGSGIQGGLAQINDQSLFNLTGVNTALETGRQINTFNQQISRDKIQSAQLGGQASSGAGFASLGGAILKAGPVFGQFSQGFGKSTGGGNYSGTPGASNTGGFY